MDEGTPIQDISEEWGVDVYPLLSWFRRDRVQSAEVMVVGCGALGNEVLKNLALFGFEHIIVVDYDRVELSNLTRSILFSHEDAGKLKVEAVARKVRKINPAIHIRMIAGDIAHHVGLRATAPYGYRNLLLGQSASTLLFESPLYAGGSPLDRWRH